MKTKLLIFGITGDLGTRKLLPALEQILKTGDFEELTVIGVSRNEVDQSKLFTFCDDQHFLDGKLSIYAMDLNNPDEYKKLKGYVSLSDDEQLLIYMAVPPLVTAQMVEYLGQAGLNAPNIKILFEKPFGVDLDSAEKLIEQTASHYREEQIYRIDHYLAKEMAQNVVAFRGRNALFSDVWDNNFIESISITAAQKIDIEGRAHFYEQTGALRDIVQGHLMQLLALVLMDIPSEFEWDQVPQLRLMALDQLNSSNPNEALRGQYEGYKDEVSNPNSKVETFVSLKLSSRQDRWLGVPITLTSGKALSEAKTEIRVKLKSNDGAKSNCLVFNIQPNEGIEIELFVKKPGYGRTFETQHLNFNYPENTRLPDAYEQVIVDAISSQKSLFTSSGEVLQSWRILQPLQDSWNSASESPKLYPKGSDISSILA
jgi:glucose-6-phosphate 1-dehydrogenase